MEECKSKEHLPKLGILGTPFKKLRVAYWVGRIGPQQTRPKTLRRLICHLDAVLEDRDGEDWAGVTC